MAYSVATQSYGLGIRVIGQVMEKVHPVEAL